MPEFAADFCEKQNWLFDAISLKEICGVNDIVYGYGDGSIFQINSNSLGGDGCGDGYGDGYGDGGGFGHGYGSSSGGSGHGYNGALGLGLGFGC